MKTVDEMLNYIEERQIKYGWASWIPKHLKVIADHLMPNEEVYICFTGLHNRISSSNHQGYYAYAFTNKRLLLGQKGVFGETFKYIELDSINDITKTTGMLNGDIIIDSYKERFSVHLVDVMANKVFPLINEYMMTYKSKNSNPPTNNPIINQLRELKTMLEENLITEEEYNQKKKQILGL